MPMGKPASISTETTKAQIRCMAAFLTFMAWAAGLGLGAQHGKDFSEASSAAIVAALCGLAGWITYHIVSRQNNGLAFLITAPCLSRSFWQHPPSLGPVTQLLLLQVMLGLVFGFSARGLNVWKAKRSATRHAEPLYDAQLDQAV
jgi:hypothetical protein